jgi:hypothetical protein
LLLNCSLLPSLLRPLILLTDYDWDLIGSERIVFCS